MDKTKNILIQCDFDGTVTVDDISFMLLDAFAMGDWRTINRQYSAGDITVGQFNERAFNLVKTTKNNMLCYIDGKVKIRQGFISFVKLCQHKGIRLVIVSNGLDFYIKKILEHLGLNNLEFHAAETRFHSNHLKVRYLGPDGSVLDDEFKEQWAQHYLDEGYQVVYIGNGKSDLPAARKSHGIFATESLLEHCNHSKVDCIPFTSFDTINRVIRSW